MTLLEKIQSFWYDRITFENLIEGCLVADEISKNRKNKQGN